MAKKPKGSDNKVVQSNLNIIFVPVSKNDCIDPYLIEEIQEVAAQIVLLSSKRGRPSKKSEEELNAA